MTAASQDLCTVAQVREYMMRTTGQNTDNDALIQSEITRVSDAIMVYTGHEFVTLFGTGNNATPKVYDGVGTRHFEHAGGMLILAPYTLRSLTSITMDTDGTSPANTVLTADQYRLRPVNNRDGVYTQVQLRGFAPAPRTSYLDYRPTRELTITGTWGYPAVPNNVVEAAICTVAFQLRDGAFIGQDFEGDASRYGSVMFPTKALNLLASYHIRGI